MNYPFVMYSLPGTQVRSITLLYLHLDIEESQLVQIKFGLIRLSDHYISLQPYISSYIQNYILKNFSIHYQPIRGELIFFSHISLCLNIIPGYLHSQTTRTVLQGLGDRLRRGVVAIIIFTNFIGIGKTFFYLCPPVWKEREKREVIIHAKAKVLDDWIDGV